MQLTECPHPLAFEEWTAWNPDCSQILQALKTSSLGEVSCLGCADYFSTNALPSGRMNRRAAGARRDFYNGRRGYKVPRQFDVVIERDQEGYYIASVPQIPACHTQARSLDEVTQRIREAI